MEFATDKTRGRPVVLGLIPAALRVKRIKFPRLSMVAPSHSDAPVFYERIGMHHDRK